VQKRSNLANIRSKTCWGCGQSLIRHNGRAEAVVGADDRLYCHRTGCEEVALISHIQEMQRAGVIARGA
jgi:hypothetical protein